MELSSGSEGEGESRDGVDGVDKQPAIMSSQNCMPCILEKALRVIRSLCTLEETRFKSNHLSTATMCVSSI